MDAFTRGYAALKNGNTARARQHLGELESLARNPSESIQFSSNIAVLPVLEQELRASIMWSEGKRNEAIALLRRAAKTEDALPMEFGPPDILKPTHELLGELLLASGQAKEAQKEFEQSLKLAPGRALSLLGLGRAALASGDTTVARKALADLKRNWHAADPAELTKLNQLASQPSQ
jgi:tetratricopeptide (TPR) repeat protein